MPSASHASEVKNALEEIVVTSQRRTQSAQDVPISLLAYDSNLIDRQRLAEVEDVAALTPNVVIGNESNNNLLVFIRGIGTKLRGAGSQQSVGFAVDEVFLTRGAGLSQDLFDVERIEVLRGPQGTLYGKNVVGGVINVINSKPARDPYSKIELGAGGYDLVEAKGVVNVPVGETMALRVSANYRKRDGYVQNDYEAPDPALVNPDPFNNFGPCPDCSGDMDDVDSLYIRSALTGNPNEYFSWTLNAYHNTWESNGVHTKISNIISGPFATFIPIPETEEFYSVLNGNKQGFSNQDFTLVSLKLEYETSIGTLTSITANQWLDYEIQNDVINTGHGLGPDGGAGFRSEPNTDESTTVFSQEFRLSSSDESRLTWLVGAYYSQENIDRTYFRPRRMTRSLTEVLSTSAPKWTQDAKRESIAGFAQITYAVTDSLNVTGGLRFTKDKLKFSTAVTNPLADMPWITSLAPATEVYGPTDSSESWSEPTGQISIDYHINDNVMVYGLYSRGFKSGGFQGSAPNEAAAIIPFEPEFANNYEIGLKSTLLEDTLLFNFTYFHTDFSNLQLQERRELVPGDPTTAVMTVFNAASSKIDGTEFELVWATPLEGLRLSMAGGTLSTKIGESANPLNVGTDLPQAPKVSGSIIADYTHDLGNDSFLDVSIAYRYTGDFWWDVGNKEPGKEDGYGLLDANASLSKDNWKFTLWGKNLTKKKYLAFGQSITQDPGTHQGGVLVSRVGAPRTWGISVSREF
jgi:iron complex outermembrane receptor protein